MLFHIDTVNIRYGDGAVDDAVCNIKASVIAQAVTDIINDAQAQLRAELKDDKLIITGFSTTIVEPD